MHEKYLRDYFIYLLIVNALIYIFFALSQKNVDNFTPYAPNIENIKIGDGNNAKIGIMSDFQLAHDLEKKNILVFKYYANNLYITLNYFKKHKIDLLIIAGDITNNGMLFNLLYFKKIFNSVYNDDNKPVVISLMGNHDYRDLTISEFNRQKNFYKVTNSYPNSHYIINGYNFIFWSTDNNLISYDGITNYTWIYNTLETAHNNLKQNGEPIFVITHIPPKKTVYGSETIWGHDGIYNMLYKYPEIICISGHSHYSLRNIKSIWQGSFTVVNTQSISYVDLDSYFANAKEVRIESAKNCDSMGLIAHLSKENIIFERVEFSTGEIMEEKWKIDFPINKDKFEYTFEKRNKKIKPVFHGNNITIEYHKENKGQNYIIFNAATHVDYIYKYKIILTNIDNKNDKKVLDYYSDYYKNEKKRKKILKYKLPENINPGNYDVMIYAYDSFYNISQPIKGRIRLQS